MYMYIYISKDFQAVFRRIYKSTDNWGATLYGRYGSEESLYDT